MSLRLPALLFCIAASALALPATAAGHGGHGGGHRSGGAGFHHSGSAGFHHSGGGFRHHHFHSGFAFFGVSPFFYDSPPYFYGAPPYYAPAYSPPPPPTTYIERFDGVPAPGMTDIVCPSTGQRYPGVTECPGGWAREMQAPQTAPAG